MIPISILTKIFGGKIAERFQRVISIGFYILIGMILVLVISQCTGDDTAERQAEQTTRSGEAIADAAKDAIDTIGDRTVTDDVIDDAVDQAQAEIGDAQSAKEIKNAVIANVCSQASHRNDPACKKGDDQ